MHTTKAARVTAPIHANTPDMTLADRVEIARTFSMSPRTFGRYKSSLRTEYQPDTLELELIGARWPQYHPKSAGDVARIRS